MNTVMVELLFGKCLGRDPIFVAALDKWDTDV